MASLIKRNSGIYYIVTSEGEKRRWRSLGSRDESLAHQFFQECTLAEEKKRIQLMSTFAEGFLRRSHNTYAHGTIDIYRLAFRNFIRIVGDKPLKFITPFDVETWKVRRLEEVRPVTVMIDLRSLRAAFNDALRLKLISENPFKGVKPVRINNEEAPYLSEGEIRRLLLVIDNQDMRDLVQFAILTCMRQGEILNLHWIDCDYDRRLIHVRSRNGFRVKGGRPRIVPMADWVYTFLLTREHKSDLVFTNPRGYLLLGGTITHKFKKYVHRAELDPRLHFHSLRHTGISLYIKRGASPAFVQRVAGHTSFRTTEIYTHFEDSDLNRMVNVLPNLN